MVFKFAWRYLWAKKSVNIIHTMVWISIVSVMIGSFSLILLLNVFNGFVDTIKKQYGDFYPDIKIQAAKKKYIYLPDSVKNDLLQNVYIKYASFIIEERALLQNGNYKSLSWIAGVDNHFDQVIKIADYIYNDKLFLLGDIGHPNLIMNENISYQLHLYNGNNNDFIESPIVVRIPKYNGGLNPSLENNLNSNIAVLKGIYYNTDPNEKERQRVYAPLDFVQSMINVDTNTFSAVAIKLKDSSIALKAKNSLEKLLREHHISNIEVLTREEQNKDFYHLAHLEKKVVFYLLIFILLIASCGIIGTIRMLITEKKKDAMILFALGLTRSVIYKIFITESLLIGIIGSILGLVLAYILSLLQIYFPFVYMPSENEIQTPYPIGLKINDFLSVFLVILVINGFAILIGLRKFRINITSLRNE